MATAIVVVSVARALQDVPAVQGFLAEFPGQAPLRDGAPTGFPDWLRWQHFLNSLFILLIIRSGLRVRFVQRPAAYWTRDNSGLLHTKAPPKRISLDLWVHLSFDALWMLNGLAFYVLLFTTGQWMRLVPAGVDVIPNAISAGLQYASLDWPLEDGWVNYNSLQLLSYFVTVFVAAPLAIISGARLSGAWPRSSGWWNRAYPIEFARALHFGVMIYFVLFSIAHVFLVFATGALRNLNHIYAGRDDESWVGLWIFAAALAVMALAWLAMSPLVIRPVASLTGRVSR